MGESQLPFCACGCGERVSKKGNAFIHGHYVKNIPKLPFCACGCGERVKNKRNAFIHGHNCGNEGYRHPGLNSKPEVSKFVEDNRGKHICACGCGGIIEIKSRYYTVGIPKFIHGHNSKFIRRGGRRKPDIIKICEWCGESFNAKRNNDKKFCCDKCRYDYQTYVMKYKNRVNRIMVICEYCGNEFEIRETELGRRFCRHKCYTDWCSENLFGENNSLWTGGQEAQDARRRNLGYEPLNDKFPGSNGHHITRTLVIHIPQELHKHVWHNLRTGNNMDIINMLALQYLNGCYDDGNS